MTIQQAIEKSIEGGWNSKSRTAEFIASYDAEKICFVFLDPKFWQALGKTEGWGDTEGVDERTFWSGTIDYPEVSDEGKGYREVWRWNMHRMIDALAEEKTIEEFLATL